MNDNKPYSLRLGDCLDVLAGIPSHSVDLALCDLPYGTTQNKWDAIIPLDRMWDALRRVLKPGAPFVTTSSQPFTSVLIASNLRAFRYEWVWEKNKASGHLNASWRPMRAHEDIVVFCDRKPPYYPQMTEGHEAGHYAKRAAQSSNYGKAESTEYGGSTKRQPRTVVRFPVVNNDNPDKWHPTQKPVELYEYLLRTYCLEGSMVMDIAMGSGTTGVACANTGRRFVGIEKEEDIFARASRRVINAFAPVGAVAPSADNTPHTADMFGGAA
jgi:DNA modification methylase